MRSGVNTLKQEMQAFDRLTYMYQNPGGQSNSKLSGKEKIKRVRAMQEFKESCQIAFQQHESMVSTKLTAGSGGKGSGKGAAAAGMDLEDQQPLMADGTMSTKALKLQQRQLLNQQEDQLDEIMGVTKAIKYEGQNIDTELKSQAPIMENLKDEMDKNQMKMMKLDSKLKTLVAQTSACKLTLFIILEFIILVLLVLMF